MGFEFDSNTAFEGHKGSSDGPKKRRGGRTSKAGDKPRSRAVSKATKEPGPEDPPATPAQPDVMAVPAKVHPRHKTGLPKSGRYPFRLGKKFQASHRWASLGEWKPAFLEALVRHGNIGQACVVAGVARGTIYNHQKADPAFDAAFKEANEAHNDLIRSEVARRGIEGDEIWVYDKDIKEFVSGGKRRSENLLMFHAKMRMPEYKDSFQGKEQDGTQATIAVMTRYLLMAADPNVMPEDLPTLKQIQARVIDTPAISLDPSAQLAQLREQVATLEAQLAAQQAQP